MVGFWGLLSLMQTARFSFLTGKPGRCMYVNIRNFVRSWKFLGLPIACVLTGNFPDASCL
jgi:hypothetical protein